MQQSEKGIASVGFISLAFAVLVAFLTPPSNYELSIYSGPLLVYWTLVGIVLIIALFLILISEEAKTYGYSMGFFGAITILTLPLIRGYYFFGEEDPMTHLGWTRDILSGSLDLTSFLYPGMHTYAAVITNLTGMSPRRALLLMPSVLILSWIIFLPVIVRRINRDQRSLPIAFGVALILTPLNPFNVFTWPHPSGQAIFFSSILVFLYLHITQTHDRRSVGLFFIGLLSLLTYHPQQVINLLSLLFVVSIVSKFDSDGFIRKQSGPILIMVAGIISLWIWIQSNPRFNVFLRGLIIKVLSPTSGDVASRSESLASLGVDIEIFALKIGSKYLILASLCLIVMVNYKKSRKIGWGIHFILGTIPIALMFFVMFLSGNSSQWGRYLGFLMIPVTIVAVLGLRQLQIQLRNSFDRQVATTATSGIIVLLFLVSLPILIPSPFIEKPNEHVTKQQFTGYETSFEYAKSETPFVRIRSSPNRYEDAIYGSEGNPSVAVNKQQYQVPDHFANQQLPEFYDTPHYLPVTEAEYKQDISLYQGFRFNRSDFQYLNQNEQISKIYSNSGYKLYLLKNRKRIK